MPEVHDHIQKMEVEVMSLREQVRAISDGVQEIKANLTGLTAMDRAIHELTIYTKQAQEGLKQLAEKHEEARAWQHSHESTTHKMVEEQLDDGVEKALLASRVAEAKLDEWVNKAKGAAWLGGILLTLFNGFMVASVLWVFNNIAQMRENDKVQDTRIEQLFKTNERANKITER